MPHDKDNENTANLKAEQVSINERAPSQSEENSNQTATSTQAMPVENADIIKDLKNKLLELSNKYLRSLADIENLKKRSEKNMQDTRNFAISAFVKELLVVVDIFDKAFISLEVDKITDTAFKNFAIGMELTQKELHKTLEKFAVKIIKPLNEKFNPNFHEALFFKEDQSLEDGIIFEVSENGYSLNNRLLRPAKVGIIKNNTK